ncbi:uncharacterized protein LOC122318183 isoform X1 [Carya illinoinensis]|uniref:uncharacterized protein LOC122318183 isoform X1 n=1 Tax=Carya illinoinensis TaxID=32201 RepID=UPI001C71FF70|nr:uncharacterized protein LOC122318183 isoform X1 [Carya illinoinensis]
MEGVSATTYKVGLRGYWRRRGYEKLNGSGHRRRTRSGQLGSSRWRSRFWRWRIKITPRLRVLRLPSPKSLLVRLRDWYVKLMLRLANSRVCSVGGYGTNTVAACDGFPRGTLKEYDEKMIVEIYKSMVMGQGHLVPRQTAKLCSESFGSKLKSLGKWRVESTSSQIAKILEAVLGH